MVKHLNLQIWYNFGTAAHKFGSFSSQNIDLKFWQKLKRVIWSCAASYEQQHIDL